MTKMSLDTNYYSICVQVQKLSNKSIDLMLRLETKWSELSDNEKQYQQGLRPGEKALKALL